MSSSRRAPRMVRGLTIGLLAAAAVVVLLTLRSGSDDGFVLRAEFRDAAGLRQNSDVKVGGVPGGKIKKIELTARDTALVTMHLEENALPIGRNATASARPVNLLGEKYVDLDAGDPRKPTPSGTTIAVSRTGAPVELDDVLNSLDPTTRGRMRVIINEFGIGMRGRSSDMNTLLERMPSSLDEAQKLVGSFAADTGRLERLAVEGDRVLTAFTAGKDDLTGLVDVAQRTLRITATSRADLGRTIDAVPGALRQLRTTLTELHGTATHLRPAARELRRTAGPLATTLARLPRFADDARPTLAQAERSAPILGRLGREGAPVVARLEPVAQDLDRFSRLFDPLSRVLDRQANPLLRVMEGWARAIQTRDTAGHLFRTEAIPDHQLAEHLVDKLTTRDAGNRPQDTGPSAEATKATIRLIRSLLD